MLYATELGTNLVFLRAGMLPALHCVTNTGAHGEDPLVHFVSFHHSNCFLTETLLNSPNEINYILSSSALV